MIVFAPQATRSPSAEDLPDEAMRLELLEDVVRGQLDVGVLEPDDEADRDVLLAHRVDERAAELAVLRPLAKRPAHRVDDLVERLRDLPDLLHAERPDLRVAPLEAEAVDRGGREVAGGAFREDGDPRRDVDAGLEVRERLAVAAPTLVARPHPDDAPVVDEERLAGRLGEDHHARGLCLLGEEPAELRHGDDPVAVVHHRRRRRDPESGALRQEVDGLAVHRPVGRHLLHGDPAREQLPDRARVHDGAREQVRARLLALLEDGDRHVTEQLARLGMLLEELPEAHGAREPAGAATDDQDPDVDALVGRVGHGADRLGVRERRWEVDRADAHGRPPTTAPSGAR